jgi:sodium transport system permease protein
MHRPGRVVFAREAFDLLRDRRSLFLLFALPLLMPILGVLGGAFVMWQVVRQTGVGLPVAVINGDALENLVDRLEDKDVLRLEEAGPDPQEAIRRGDLVALLEIPPDAAARLQAEVPVTVTLTSGRGGWMPDLAAVIIQQALAETSDDVLAKRLGSRGLGRSWLEPIRLERAAAAPAGLAAAPIVAGAAVPTSLGSLFLPLAVASWAFSGGLSMMADMTVGEKERRTMESLLITPASRVGVVMGKIGLSIVVSAITVGLWSMDSLAYVWLISSLPAGVQALALPPVAQLGGLGVSLVWLVLLMLPLMTMANGLVAAMGAFAKNYRESNLFLGFLQLMLPGVAFLSVFSVGARPPLAVYALPVVGVLVALRDLFGGGMAPEALALAWVAAATYAVVAVKLAAYVFSREWAVMRGV